MLTNKMLSEKASKNYLHSMNPIFKILHYTKKTGWNNAKLLTVAISWCMELQIIFIFYLYLLVFSKFLMMQEYTKSFYFWKILFF